MNLPQKLDLNSNDWKAVQFTAIFIGSVYILFYTSIEKTLTCLTKRGIKNERILRQGERHKMGKYNFDEVIDRHGTDCLKYDFGMKRKGRDDLLPLWVADMDFRLPDEILDEFHKRIDHGIFGYTDPLDEYFAAMNHWFSTRYGYTIEPDWVTLGAGIVYALGTSVRAFTEKGDAMMVMQPVYYPFSEVIADNGRRVVSSTLVLGDDNCYHMDVADFEERLKAENVKLFFLCNPHNPVGRVWTKEELTAIGDLCVQYNVTVVSDEIHGDFIFKGEHQVFAAIKKEYEDITITCTAPSKTFNLASMMMSNIFIANPELRAKFRKQLDAAGTSQLGVMGLVACETAYNKGEEWYEAMLSYVKANAEFTKQYVEEQLPGVKMIDLEGTYLVWLDFRKTGLSVDELEDLMINKAKLWLDSGKSFGDCGRGFQRINIACPRATLTEALERIRDAMKSR